VAEEADGLDPEAGPGSGLAGLAERAARLGGTLSAGAGPRGGFWLRVSVPLVASPDGEPDCAAALEPGPERMPS
jgi:two-component system, NarL family, sensor histidine kinase DesK